MENGKIVDLVMGLISALIIGAIAFLFTSIAELKHNQDIMGVQMNQNSSELNDLWSNHNSSIEKREVEMNKEFDFALKLINDNTRVELALKDLQIKLLENEKSRVN